MEGRERTGTTGGVEDDLAVRDLAEQAGLREPETLGNQLLMLMDGAWIASRMYGPQNPGVDLAAAARALVAAHGQ